jgi:hypothetical protein
VKKASQTKAVPQSGAMHRRDEKAGRNSERAIDARMRQHVRFPI